MNTQQILQIQQTDKHNFIQNGNFHHWSQGDTIEYNGGKAVFLADDWFGRRGNLEPGIVSSKHSLVGSDHNSMRISRQEGNQSPNEIGIAQVLKFSDKSSLEGKSIYLSLKLRAGANYSNPSQQVTIYIISTSQSNAEELNPFSLGKKSQTIGRLKATLEQRFANFSLIAKVPYNAQQIMLVLRTLELSDSAPATAQDYFEIADVNLTTINDFPSNSKIEDSIPIIHVASMARSGETVFLRSLNAHPQIYNLVNLKAKDNESKNQIFKFLQNYEFTLIDKNHLLIEELKIKPNQTLMLKQGVWEHKHPFNGVVLVRNPISVYASMIAYGNASLPEDFKDRKKALTRNCKRWLRNIDPQLLDSFDSLNVIEQFCSFYNRRMYPLSQLGLPIVHYEEFCIRPEPYLKAVLSSVNLNYDESVTQSHLNYSERQTGHGLIDLAEPINPKSLNKWQKYIPERQFNIITALTYNTWKAYGYQIEWPNISVKQSALLA